jgi:NAD(P)-dependent dehydrogenase (short-subunit alcohol dehydrogenase family)
LPAESGSAEHVASLTGRVAVVTGASRGIGRAVVVRLGRAGASVAVLARGREAADVVAAISGAGASAIAVACDVTNDASVETAFLTVRSELGPVGILVNCAGRHVVGHLEDFGPADYRELFETNVLGAVRATASAVSDMKALGSGQVVNVASTAGRAGSLYQCPYNTTKHALVGFTRSAALELAPFAITVNAVCPGWVETGMMRDLVEGQARLRGLGADETAALLLARVPTGRLVKPEEVAELCAYLVTPLAASVTGQTFTIDGGLLTA